MTRVAGFLAGLLLAAAALTCQAAAASAADKVKVSLASADDPIYLPVFIAIEKGYYRGLDLDTEIVYAGGGIATPGLMSGSLSFSTSTSSAESAILKGAPLKIVMSLSESAPWRLWTTQPGIKTVRDLKDKAVGVQSRGDLFELSMRAFLLQQGLNGDFVRYAPLGFGSAERLAVIQNGALPAVLLTNLEARRAREHGLLGHARMLADITKDVRIPNNGLATSDKLLKSNPALVERFVRATMMGLRYMMTQRDASLRLFAKYVPDTSADVLASAIEETASGLLESGMTQRETQQTEIRVRATMLDMTPDQIPPVDKVFDYRPVIQATQTLEANRWVPSE